MLRRQISEDIGTDDNVWKLTGRRNKNFEKKIRLKYKMIDS